MASWLICQVSIVLALLCILASHLHNCEKLKTQVFTKVESLFLWEITVAVVIQVLTATSASLAV